MLLVLTISFTTSPRLLPQFFYVSLYPWAERKGERYWRRRLFAIAMAEKKIPFGAAVVAVVALLLILFYKSPRCYTS
jgi:hypothetical protein